MSQNLSHVILNRPYENLYCTQIYSFAIDIYYMGHLQSVSCTLNWFYGLPICSHYRDLWSKMKNKLTGKHIDLDLVLKLTHALCYIDWILNWKCDFWVISIPRLSKGPSDLNPKNRHHFLAQFFMPYLVVWFVLFGPLDSLLETSNRSFSLNDRRFWTMNQ